MEIKIYKKIISNITYMSDTDRDIPLTKPKKKMTQKQLENLQLGREKNTEKKKQRLIDAAKFLIENNISLSSVQKNKKIREKFLKETNDDEDDEIKEKVIKNKSNDDNIIIKKEKMKCPAPKKEKAYVKKKKTIIIEESESEPESESESEEEEIIVKKVKKPCFKSQENTRSKIKITKRQDDDEPIKKNIIQHHHVGGFI